MPKSTRQRALMITMASIVMKVLLESYESLTSVSTAKFETWPSSQTPFVSSDQVDYTSP